MMRRAVVALALLAWPFVGLAQDGPATQPQNLTQPPAQRPAPKPAEAEAVPPSALPVAPPKAAPKEAAAPDRVVPSGPPMHQTLREDDFAYSACLLDLAILGAQFSQDAPVRDPQQRDCGIDRPITLHAPLPGIEIPGGAVMRCQTAWHLAHWLRDFVRPATALLPGQPRLVAVEPGSTYQCRATVGNAAENLSEHAFGNAFDLAAFRFADGSRIAIAPRKDEGDLTEAFQQAVRGAACLHFTTVLGPGSNAAHDDHLHLDIKARKSGWRLCQ